MGKIKMNLTGPEFVKIWHEGRYKLLRRVLDIFILLCILKWDVIIFGRQIY